MHHRIIKASYIIGLITAFYFFCSLPANPEAKEWILPEFDQQEAKDDTFFDHITRLRKSIDSTIMQSLRSLPEYPPRAGNQIVFYLRNNTSTDFIITDIISCLDEKVSHYNFPIDDREVLHQKAIKKFSIPDISPGKHTLRIKFLIQEILPESHIERRHYIAIGSCRFLNEGYCLHHQPAAYDTRLIKECSLDFSLRKNQTLPVIISFDYSSISSDYSSVAQIVPISPGTPEEYQVILGIAEGFFHNREYLKCAWVLNSILKDAPGYPLLDKVLFLMGESFFHMHMYPETMKISQQLRQKFPRSRHSHLCMLRVQMIHYLMQQYAQAIADFQQFGNRTDADILYPARYIAAQSYYHEKDLGRAAHVLKSIYPGSPYYLPAQYLQALCFLKADQYDAAVAVLEKIVRSETSAASFSVVPELKSFFGKELETEGLIERSNLVLGKIFYRQKEYEKSLNAFEAIPETSPHYPDALTGMGLIFLRLHKEKKLLDIMDKFPEERPGNRFLSDVRFSLADTLQKKGNYEEARALYQESMKQCRAGLSLIQSLEQDKRLAKELLFFVLKKESPTQVLPSTARLYQEVRNYPKLHTSISRWHTLLGMEKTLHSMKSLLFGQKDNCRNTFKVLFQLMDQIQEDASFKKTPGISKVYGRIIGEEEKIKEMKEAVISRIKKDIHECLAAIADRLSEIHDRADLLIMVTKLKEQLPRSVKDGSEDLVAPLKKGIKAHESFLEKYPHSPYAEQITFQLAEYYYQKANIEFQHQPELLIQTRPNFDEAVRLYEKLISEFPQGEYTDKSLYALATAYQNQGSIVLTKDLFQRLVDGFPDSFLVPEVLLCLGEIFFDEDNFARAADCYARTMAFEKFPEQYRDIIRYKLGWSYYQLNQYKEAFDIFVSLADQFVRTNRLTLLQELIHQLAKLLSEHDSLEHVKKVLNFMEGKTYHFQTLKEFADILFAQERFEESINAYHWAIKQYPFHPATPILQSGIEKCHINLNNQASAHAAREALIVRYGKGTRWWKENKTEEARKQASCLIDEAIRNSTSYLLKLKHEKNYREMIAFYKETLTLLPSAEQVYTIHFSLAECFYNIGHYNEALARYEQTIQNKEFDKFAEDAAYKQIFCLEKIIEQKYLSLDTPPPQGEWIPEEHGFIAAIDHFISSFPQHKSIPEVLYKKGEFYFQKNLHAQGVKAFEQLVHDFPESTIRLAAMKMIAKARFSQEHFDSSAKEYARIVKECEQKLKNTQSPDLLTARSNAFKMMALSGCKEAELLLKQGAPLKAAEKLEVTADTFPEVEVADMALFEAATIYQTHGDIAKALKIFSRIVRQYPDSENAPKALLHMALYYEKDKRHQEAARTYEKVYFDYPRFSGSPKALYKAGILYEQMENWPKVAAIFGLYQTELHPEPSLAIESIFRRGYALMNTGDTIKANAAFHAVLNIYDRYRKHDDTLSAYYPARAQFLISDQIFKTYNNLKIKEISERGMQPKLALLKKVIEHNTKTAEFKIGEWTTQAIFRMGLAIDNFCDELWDRPPAVLSTADSSYLLNIRLQQRIIGYLKKAASFYKKNTQLAEKNNINNIWTATSTENLTKDYWKIGHLHEKIYVLIKEAPVPEILDETEAQHYRKALLAKAVLYRDKAVEAYCPNTNAFMENITYNTWIEQSYARLAVLKPELYLRDEALPLEEDRSGLVPPDHLLLRDGIHEANTYYKNGDYEECLKQLNQLSATGKGDPYIHYNLGLVYSRLKKNYLARTEYELALTSQITPHIPEIYKGLGDLYQSQHLYERAADAYSKALKIVPKSKKIRNCLVKAYAKMGNMELAIKECKRKPRLYLNLGNLYCRLARYDEAISSYKKALDRDPSLVGVYNNLGVVHGKKGDIQKSLEYYQEALKKDADHVSSTINLGILYRSMGKYELAEKHYMQGLKIKPGCPEALLNLGILYDIYMHRTDKAIKHYQQYCQGGGPISAEVREWIALLQQKK